MRSIVKVNELEDKRICIVCDTCHHDKRITIDFFDKLCGLFPDNVEGEKDSRIFKFTEQLLTKFSCTSCGVKRVKIIILPFAKGVPTTREKIVKFNSCPPEERTKQERIYISKRYLG